MDLKDKTVLAHKGYFNKDSEKTYRENSKEICGVSGYKDYIDIIELDVRKSADGTLYCYHGTLFEYWITLKIPRKFSDLQRELGIDSLKTVLEVIPNNKIVCLDLKDKSITQEDIVDALASKEFKEVILGNTSITSVSFLERFDDLGDRFVKIMNGNIFCNFYNLQKLKDKGYKYFEVVLPFQVRENIIKKVEKHGLEFRCAGLFFNNTSYWNKINKYNIKHVSSDFI